MKAVSLVATCSCGQSFRATPELAGRRVQCPTCGAPLQIPPQAAPPSAESDPLGLGPLDETAFNAPVPSSPGSVTLSTPTSYATPARNKSGSGSNRGLYIALGVGGGVMALVVVVVVLLALLLPAVRAARDAARRAQAKSDQPAAASGDEAVSEEHGVAASDWETYTSSTGGYSIFMPRSVTVKNRPTATPHGRTQLVLVTAEQGNRGAFCASHCFLPRVAGDPNQIVEQSVQGMMRTYSTTVSSHRSFTFEGCPAREVEFDGGHLIGHVQVILAGNTVYQLFWMGPPGSKPEQEVRRFFDSFKLSRTTAPPSPAATADRPSTTRPPIPTRPTRTPPGELTETQKKSIYRMVTIQERGIQLAEQHADTLDSAGQSDAAARIREAADEQRRSMEERLQRTYQLTREKLMEIMREGQQKGW